MNENIFLVTKALIFATAAHAAVGQVRKYTGDPYIVHPIHVAGIVASVPHTDSMLAAALLHDVLEDTQVTVGLLHKEFGDEVASLVLWLTSVSVPSDGNRAYRKDLDLKYLAQAPAAAQTVKLADLISNTSTIVEHDPDFAEVYLKEKAALLEVLTKGDPILWTLAQRTIVGNAKEDK